MIRQYIWAFLLNNRAKKGSKTVLENLHIREGDTIADIGSGGGYYTFEMAILTGQEGKIFAVDTDAILLAIIAKKTEKRSIKNIKTVICKEAESLLPKESCDLIFMRNIFHHLTNPLSYFTDIRDCLKDKGRLAIIDWEKTDSGYIGRNRHYSEEKQIWSIMMEAGFSHLQSFDFLEAQSFNIFAKGQ